MSKPTQEEMFEYLVDLRDSGVVNMWGASPFLEDRFNLTRQEANKVLVAWIDSLDKK
jgi:hypothetical protein